MNKPEYIKVDGVLYKINTDFRVALECNKVISDESINDNERALAIIYLLFGEKGFECQNQSKMLDLAIKYLTLNSTEKPLKNDSSIKYKLDFLKCENLISSSFKYDYTYDPYKEEYLHWYDFYNDLKNLSCSEYGSCCILNRISNFLNYDVTEIKDLKKKQEILDAKHELYEQFCIQEKPTITKKQEESAIKFYKALGIDLK